MIRLHFKATAWSIPIGLYRFHLTCKWICRSFVRSFAFGWYVGWMVDCLVRSFVRSFMWTVAWSFHRLLLLRSDCVCCRCCFTFMSFQFHRKLCIGFEFLSQCKRWISNDCIYCALNQWSRMEWGAVWIACWQNMWNWIFMTNTNLMGTEMRRKKKENTRQYLLMEQAHGPHHALFDFIRASKRHIYVYFE